LFGFAAGVLFWRRLTLGKIFLKNGQKIAVHIPADRYTTKMQSPIDFVNNS